MDLSYIFFALVLGLLAGLLARALMPGKDDMSLLMTTLLGLIGAFVGASLFRLVGVGDGESFDLGGLIGAVIGAMVVLGLYNAITGRKRRGAGRPVTR